MAVRQKIIGLNLSRNIERALLYIVDYIDSVLGTSIIDQMTEDYCFEEVVNTGWDFLESFNVEIIPEKQKAGIYIFQQNLVHLILIFTKLFLKKPVCITLT